MTELEPGLIEVMSVIDEAMVERSPWCAFTDWARVFHEDPGFASIERDYKIHVSSAVREVCSQVS